MRKPRPLRTIHIRTHGARTLRSVVTTDKGKRIPGIKAIDLRMRLNEAITATVELYSGFEGDAVPTFVMLDPVSGNRKQIVKVEFVDGSVYEPDALEPTSADASGAEAEQG